MIKLRQTIVVEGRYDKSKLATLFDANIIETGGFVIFKDAEKLALLRRLAAQSGVILLTDSDAAGFRIRAFLSGALPKEQITHVYIPDVYGKERRKERPSAEGKLGVEGVDKDRILQAFRLAGVPLDGDPPQPKASGAKDDAPITAADLYADGLTGGPDAATRRRRLQSLLGLPARLSTAALLQILNRLYTRRHYRETLLLLSGEFGDESQ